MSNGYIVTSDFLTTVLMDDYKIKLANGEIPRNVYLQDYLDRMLKRCETEEELRISLIRGYNTRNSGQKPAQEVPKLKSHLQHIESELAKATELQYILYLSDLPGKKEAKPDRVSFLDDLKVDCNDSRTRKAILAQYAEARANGIDIRDKGGFAERGAKEAHFKNLDAWLRSLEIVNVYAASREVVKQRVADLRDYQQQAGKSHNGPIRISRDPRQGGRFQ